jgi:FixJ family two-component response regulator
MWCAASFSSKGYNLPSLKIVSIVDDDESIRTSTGSLVRSMGWEARVYESADRFLDSGEISQIDCIVCDVHMPGTTGLELLRTLRVDGHQVTIIIATGYLSVEINREALAGGALCVLEKPVDPGVLCDWLCRALDER